MVFHGGAHDVEADAGAALFRGVEWSLGRFCSVPARAAVADDEFHDVTVLAEFYPDFP